MNQFATIPLTTWISWAAVAIALTLMILALKKSKPFRLDLDKTEVRAVVLYCTTMAALFTMLGVVAWRDDAASKQREWATINQAIEADPNLSRMANVAEALGWMDEEVDPLVLKLNRATERLERLERDREAAIAEIKVINAQLGEKGQEFERRFGHLAPPIEQAEGRSLSPLMIDPNAVYRAVKK